MADTTDEQTPTADDAFARQRAIAAFALLAVFVVSLAVGAGLVGGLGWAFLGLSVGALVSAYLLGSE